MHDPTKVKLGATGSSQKESSCYAADPASFPAGTAVRQKSDGTISVTKADGMLLGVSLGKSLSDHKKISVVRDGLAVPILLTDDSDDYAYVIKGDKVYVDDVTGLANIADTVDVTTTITDAIYVSGVLDGVLDDGTTVKVALIDMQGGL